MRPCEAMAGTVSDRKGKGGARAARLLRARLLSHIYMIRLYNTNIHTLCAQPPPGGARAPGSVK